MPTPTVAQVHQSSALTKPSDKELTFLRALREGVERLLAEFEEDDDTEEMGDIAKPLPAEHTARQAEPSQFTALRRKNNAFGPGISVIYGIKDGKTVVQSLRFAKDKFTPEQARKWLAEHDYKTGVEAAREDEVEKAVNVIDRLISTIHREFTVQADYMYGDGIYGQDERIALSNAIGEALDTFNKIIDEQLPHLRSTNPVQASVMTEATMFAKSDEEQIAYAIAYPAMPDGWADTQNDHMEIPEIEKMAHAWMESSQNYDIQHQILDVAKSEAHIVESFIAPIDINWPLPDGSTKLVTKGSWVVATKFGPTLWPRVKSGLLKAYSIRGKGIRKVKQVTQ